MKRVALALCLMACGDSAPPNPTVLTDDAPTISPTDGPGCGTPQPVRVIGRRSATADENQTTTFLAHAADGTMCGRMTVVGPEPVVMLDVPVDGMVTAASEARGVRRYFTWTGVQPGDELTFPSRTNYAPQRTVPVTFDVAPFAGDVVGYNAAVQCDGGALDIVKIPVGPNAIDVMCATDAENVIAHVRAFTGDATYYAVSAYTPIAATGPTALALSAWDPGVPSTTTVHGTTGMQVRYAASSLQGQRIPAWSAVGDTGPDDPTVTTVRLPDEPVQIQVDTDPYVAYGCGLSVRRSYPSLPANLELSTETDFLPCIRRVNQQDHPWQVTWTTARPVPDADILFVGFMLDPYSAWAIEADGTASSLRLPELPIDLLSFTLYEPYAIRIIESTDVSGYAAIRQKPFEIGQVVNWRQAYDGDPSVGIFPIPSYPGQ